MLHVRLYSAHVSARGRRLVDVRCRRRAPRPSRRSQMEIARGSGDAAAVRRVTSRRSLLKGLTALMAVGAVAPLAAACAPQQPAAKPAETKPAAPAATTAPAAAPAAAK